MFKAIRRAVGCLLGFNAPDIVVLGELPDKQPLWWSKTWGSAGTGRPEDPRVLIRLHTFSWPYDNRVKEYKEHVTEAINKRQAVVAECCLMITRCESDVAVLLRCLPKGERESLAKKGREL